jgi:uncharacterized membrane protein YhaH (DUF805 family)
MTFTQAVPSVLRSYATFSGRARRSEYWWFYLFTVLVSIVASVIDDLLGAAFGNQVGIIGVISGLALLLPTLAVTSRRLHDTGRTGWWMLLPLIPLVATIVVAIAALFSVLFGTDADDTPTLALIALLVACLLLTLTAGIVLTVFLCLNSSPGPNRYGPSPKQPAMLPSGTGGYYPFAGDSSPYGSLEQPPAPGPSPSQP